MTLRLVFLFVLVLCAAAAASPADDIQAAVDAFNADNPQAPGVVVHVICPPLGLDRAFASGPEDTGSAVPLTGDHVVRIASNTKTYVAAAVLRLAEMGKLRLDDPLGRHLDPVVRDLLADDGYDLEAITIAQVLAHTGGLFQHPADPRYAEMILADPQHAWTADEQIRKCVEWGDKVGEPGEMFAYSDTGYVLLGEILKRYAGGNLGEAVRALLDYEALGLDATWWEIFEPAPAGAGPRAHQYFFEHDGTGWHPGMDLHGGGGLLCDARDLTVFPRLLLEGRVLKTDAMLGAMTGRGTGEYRLGLFCTDFGGCVAWGHTGFWNTFAFHVPSLDASVGGAVLNHGAGRGQALAERIVAIVAAAED